MKFFKLLIDNKVVIYILMAMIVIMGAIAYNGLPRESAPSVQIPYIFVSTVYIGVSPQDIESLVTQEIEKEVKGIKDIKHIISVSRESFSSVVIEFDPNVKIDDALQKVRDKVAIAKAKMPEEVQEPFITEINISELPMLYINLSGNVGLSQLKETGDKISDKIEAIPGVLSADVIGGLEREVKINVDANRMKYYNLSFSDISNAVSAENLSIPGGGMDIGQSNYLVRVPGEIEDPSIIGDLVIKSENGSLVHINDVAQVIYGYKERATYSRQNGVESITLVIKKRSGENIVQIADDIKAMLAKDKESLPAGITVSLSGDMSKMIKDTVHELENGILTGMVLVISILFLFLGLKNALLTATSIPLSFLISFIVLSLMGVTLNMVVLFALILVLGIIVDDAIVVMENIHRLQDTEGYSQYNAAQEGPREVFLPVTVATLTILSSFFPLLLFPGIVGEFMKYLPITLIVTLSSSLFVAFVISPVQASVFLDVKKEKASLQKKKIRPTVKFVHWFDNKVFGTALKIYEKVLRYSLVHRKLMIAQAVILLVISFVLYGMFNNGMEFFPSVEPRQAVINIKLPVGTNTEKTNEFTKMIEGKIPKYREIEYFVANVGSSNNPLEFSGSGIPNRSTITVNFIDKLDRDISSYEIIDEIRKIVSTVPGGEIQMEKQEMGPPTGKPINIEIAGDDFIVLGDIANQIKREIQNIPGIADLKDDFDQARPEIKVTVNREKAALYKLSTASIAGSIRTAINGTTASKYRVGDEEYDITVRLDKKHRDDISSIENLFIANRDGAKIPLTSVAIIDFSGGIGAINRKDQNRVITVSANADGRLANDVLMDVRAKLANFKLPDGYKISYTGEQEEQAETSAFLGQAFLISLLLIFLFMVIEFNSIRTPLLIMFSIPLSFIGVIAGLLITDMPFSLVMTGVGVIALAGIIVRNAIVLLDFQHELEHKRGLPRDEALVQAGLIRMRPVILTAAATIIGLVPLTTGIDFDWRSFSWVIGGENTAFWRPMGVTIIFGLSMGTFLTLVIIPTAYSAVDELFVRIKGRRKKKLYKEEAAIDNITNK